MDYELIAHPGALPNAALSIHVQAAISDYRQLVVNYELRGPINQIVVPSPVKYADRRDGLWQTTCFEAFVRGADERYLELNFAPSTAWAAYSFVSYRGEPARPPLDAPPIDIVHQPDLLSVAVAIDLSELELLMDLAQWRLNLTTVIEEQDGTKSYWALAHPADKPDFHDPACFVLELPAPTLP